MTHLENHASEALSRPEQTQTETGQARLNILCLEDNPNDAELLEMRLQSDGLESRFTRVDTRQDFTRELENGRLNLIVSDYSMPGFSGREALELARVKRPEVPFIFFSGTIGEERAVECLKIGAVDFVLKDHPARLVTAIRRALDQVDLEERQRAMELSLRTKEAQFQAFVQQSIIGVYVIQEGLLVCVNSTMASIIGHVPEEMTGRPVLDFIAPEDRGLVSQNIQKRLGGSVTSLRYQLRMLHKRGGFVDVEAHGMATEFDGRPAIMGVLLDITERKRAEEQIREQVALLDKTLNAILVRDLFGCIRYWNEGARHLYGWTTAEAVGQLADTLLFRGEPPEVAEAQRQVADRGEWHGEFKHRTRDGREVDVESHWSLIRDDGGQPKCIFVVNNDVTEKKKIDAQVRRNQRLDSIGALAGGIAHDLNNVLSPILMSMTLLRDEPLSDSGRKVIEILETGTMRGAQMVKQILLFARGAEGERSLVQLNRLLGELVKALRQMFSRSVQIELRPAEGLWSVLGDATQLHQVLMNLCVNARDAMPHGGLLRIETTNTVLDDLEARMFGAARAGNYVLVTVADTGTGIPPEIIEKIFEPFFTTKEIGQGTGLGLSTVVGIVKGQGGFVKVYSEVGRGTSFRVYLPAETSPERAANVAVVEVPRGQGEKILLVDDELALREITKAALEKNGYEVLAAADGAEAIALYAQHKSRIDIVITDMTMPIMDGPATIHALRRITPDVKIIAVSGLMVDLKAAKIEASPNIQFLAKPFDTEKLLLTLHRMLGKNSS